MKIKLSIFVALIMTLIIFSCSESNKSKTDGENTTPEVITEGTETKRERKNKTTPSQRLSVQFEELGINLSPEQATQIDAITANYNFDTAGDRDARKAMRKAFQKEVFENVLTEQQQNAYNQSRSSRQED